MNYRTTLFAVALLMLATLTAVGCASTPTPVPPTTAPTTAPTAVPQPTKAPTNTPLPPTPTTAPSNTPKPPPTNTPIPSSPTSTVTNTRVPVTSVPTVAPTSTETPVVVKFPAPQLLEPGQGDTRRTGTDDLIFRWSPVGALGGNECYLLTLRITNEIDSEYGEQSFIAQDTCNSAGDVPLEFVVHKKAPAPDYAGLVAIASSKNPSTKFKATWNVIVIQNNGADPNNPNSSQFIIISPPSQTFEFDLVG